MAELLPYPPEPVTLAGSVVRLEPLAAGHASDLAAAARDGELWKLWYTTVPAPEQIAGWIEQSLALQAGGKALPFTVRDLASGSIVGSTRYMNIEPDRRRLEIGTTWYAARVQRTALNTEAKLLLLRHAFEALGCIAVEFRTHAFNFRSREAIAKLGAKQDGILRQHMRMPNGTLRDTVVFSVLDTEWPTVKSHLGFRLDRLKAR
jgi:RimJ/RimL family protein N-acetyltransferase